MTAVLFQSMPPLSPEEYSALEQSIRDNGVQVPIVVDEAGVVIDGHHRQKITQHLGVECPSRTVVGKTDAEKRTLALSLNLDRRHLTRDQRRALIAESLKADPQLSDREHAKRTGADHKTVAAVREPLETRGEIPHASERIDSLGRQQPATKPVKLTETTKTETYIDGETGEVVEAPKPERAKPEPAKPRRRPLPDAARDAGWDLRKATERIQRLLDDDRFTQNKEQVAAHLSNHLSNAIEVCQDLLDRINPS